MEEVYPPEYFGASNKFPLKSYFKNFAYNVPKIKPQTLETDENDELGGTVPDMTQLQSLMGNTLSLPELHMLENSCSINLLECNGENTADFPMDFSAKLNANTKLPKQFTVTQPKEPLEVNTCKIELEKKKTVFELSVENKRIHHKTINFTPPATIPPDLEPNDDFIVSILIYKPMAFKYFTHRNASEKLRFYSEIMALGRNTLAEVRDKITCLADGGIYEEVENTTVDLRPLRDAKSKYPSGFIYIDNVFYNDFRTPENLDYSQPIRDWAYQKFKTEMGSSRMETMKLKNLTPRFGYPYLFMHQGDCEHILVFSDARLLQAKDCLHSQCYPHVSKLNGYTRKLCLLCTVANAKWIVVNSSRFPQKRVALCTNCCDAYNYLDGKKIGEFKLFPYYDKYVDVEGDNYSDD